MPNDAPLMSPFFLTASTPSLDAAGPPRSKQFCDAPGMGGLAAGGKADQYSNSFPGHLSVHLPSTQDEQRALLLNFVQAGCTNKHTAESLFFFCCHAAEPWIQPDSDNNNNHNNNNNHKNNNNNNNNAVAIPSPSTDSTAMCSSSSRSSQNSATHPQTPDSDHHPTLVQHYGLDQHQQPQNDVAELRPFLLRLLSFARRRQDSAKSNVRALYDMSRLPGHGTEQGFSELVAAAAAAEDHGAPVEAPTAMPINSFHAGSPVIPHASHASFPAQMQHHAAVPGYHLSPPARQFPDDSGFPFARSPPHLGRPDQRAAQRHAVQFQHLQNPQMSRLFELPGTNNQQQSPVLLEDISLLSLPDINNAASPTVRDSPPNRVCHASRPKKSRPESTAQVSPTPPKDPSSKGDRKDKEVSKKVVVRCKLFTKEGKECSKACSSEDAKNAEGNACKFLIEHIHRVHPEHYIANLPSNRKSLNDMFNVQVAECAINLENGQICSWHSAGEKPWKAGFDHIRDHHPQYFRPELSPPNKTNFEAMANKSDVIRCPLTEKDSDKPCSKCCTGAQARRSLIEHIRRAHFGNSVDWKEEILPRIRKIRPDLAGPNGSVKSEKDTLGLLCRLYKEKKLALTPAMEPSTSFSSMLSNPGLENNHLQQQLVPQDTPMCTEEVTALPEHQVQPFAMTHGHNEQPLMSLKTLDMGQIGYDALNPSHFVQDETTAGHSFVMFPADHIPGYPYHRPQMAVIGQDCNDPTLGTILFPPLNESPTRLQAHDGPIMLQQPENNSELGYDNEYARNFQPQIRVGNSLQQLATKAYTEYPQNNKPLRRKRERDTADDAEGEFQEPPSKKTSMRQAPESSATYTYDLQSPHGPDLDFSNQDLPMALSPFQFDNLVGDRELGADGDEDGTETTDIFAGEDDLYSAV